MTNPTAAAKRRANPTCPGSGQQVEPNRHGSGYAVCPTCARTVLRNRGDIVRAHR